MPKIELLADLCAGRAGSIIDVQDYEFNVLEKLGVAKLVASDVPSINVARRIVYEAVELKGLLLNLNDTPVVDDFGSFVPNDPQNPVETAPKVVKSTSKTGKKGA